MGWIYFIQNEDLFKIGITENLERRMRELQPCKLIKSLSLEKPGKLEKVLHKKYRSVRIPQTEYFRLSKIQVHEVISILNASPMHSPVQAAQQRRPPSVPNSERFSRFEPNKQQNISQFQSAPIFDLNNPPPIDYLNIQDSSIRRTHPIKQFFVRHKVVLSAGSACVTMVLIVFFSR